jgi:hypothetical protein
MSIYNIYCDESCHLENDHQKVMVLGATWCSLDKTQQTIKEIRSIKTNHNLASSFEIKWTKVSPAKLAFYQSIINYFFDNEDLHFRALVIPNKAILNHVEYQQTHNDWYYKMYFDMLKVILTPTDRYRIYLDIKDTRGGIKIHELRRVLCNNMYDFSQEIIERIQIVRSHEIEIMQVADLLMGAVSATNRGQPHSLAKQALIDLIRKRSNYTLQQTTLLREMKTNIFVWHPRRENQL